MAILNDQVVHNILVFLDRVPIQGHQEREVMNEIYYCLTHPQEDKNIIPKGDENDESI
jgi:hypothetical protein